ncbi:MAG: hypothetical protein IT167_05220 [Bryobacterales bacterium]|nr:hypothetical protein [Bryobacterales bacterium]
MLGTVIGESRGKRTGRRVLSVDGGVKIEVSFEDSGTLLGAAANTIGTYWSQIKQDGSLYGEGQGIVLTANGDMATWKGQGTGKLLAGGAASYRGALHYTTASASLAGLNSIAAVFEFDVDSDGNTHAKSWEWK